MEIQGLQKMTLLDYPGRVACTVFLGGCDLRCPFCHNSGLVLAPYRRNWTAGSCSPSCADARACWTACASLGGSPLLRPELPELLRQIKELDFPVKLDTNGSHPQRLAELVESGLVDYVAMDVKNSPERYGETVGVPGLDLAPFRESVSFCFGERWSMSSVPRWCGSSMTGTAFGPSEPGLPGRGGTSFRPLWTGTP